MICRNARAFPTLRKQNLEGAARRAPKTLPPSGNDLLNAVAAEMAIYDKPTPFIHGDTHIFHISKPLVDRKNGRFIDHFTRLEVFGDPDSHWVRVIVDPRNPGLFTIRPEIVPENRSEQR